MDRKDLLTKLAMELAEWPADKSFMQWDGDAFYPTDYLDCSPFKKYEWLAERERLAAKPEAPEWDGEGAPHIGTECEAQWLEPPDGGSRDFEPVLIKGRYVVGRGRTQYWFCTQAGEDIVMLEGNCRVRPIRSEEEKQKDELASYLSGMDSGLITPKEMAEFLYENGYRKQ